MTTKAQIGNLQKVWDQFEECIEAVIIQMGQVSDLDELVKLERKFNFYTEQQNKYEEKLNLLKNQSDSSNSPNTKHTIVQKLSKINFCTPKKIVNYILKDFLGKEGGLALFLLQNTSLMGGDLCVAEIQYCLSSNSYGRFKYCPIDPLLRPDISDEQSLLNAIADYFKPIEPDPNEQKYAQKIIDKIVDSVQGGSIIFFDFSNWDSITDTGNDNDYKLLSWFIKHFWKPLKEKHQDICKTYSRVKFLLFISISSTISEAYNELCWFCRVIAS